MKDMDGSGGNIDMNASALPVSYTSDRNRLCHQSQKAQECKTESVDLVFGFIPSAAVATYCHSFSFLGALRCWERRCRQYELTIRQEPKQARMCGIGGRRTATPSRDRSAARH
ncbi:hypothetical protein K438DRAFT_879947 [Mycena galopus ATCC 62051]|nr:hypothetical protein K438DRAFT_879947 [Mycena galopus ATCC 62051]